MCGKSLIVKKHLNFLCLSVTLSRIQQSNCSKSSKTPVRTTFFASFFIIIIIIFATADENSQRCSSAKGTIKVCVLPVIMPSCLLTRSSLLANKARLTFFGTEAPDVFVREKQDAAASNFSDWVQGQGLFDEHMNPRFWQILIRWLEALPHMQQCTCVRARTRTHWLVDQSVIRNIDFLPGWWSLDMYSYWSFNTIPSVLLVRLFEPLLMF